MSQYFQSRFQNISTLDLKIPTLELRIPVFNHWKYPRPMADIFHGRFLTILALDILTVLTPDLRIFKLYLTRFPSSISEYFHARCQDSHAHSLKIPTLDGWYFPRSISDNSHAQYFDSFHAWFQNSRALSQKVPTLDVEISHAQYLVSSQTWSQKISTLDLW